MRVLLRHYGFAVAYLAGFLAVELVYALLSPDAQARLIAWASTNVANLEQGAASMRAARLAGVPIALGSDVSLATGLEIQRMVHHGLPSADALVAATRTAAEALGLGEHIGTVAEGKLADLIVVDGDPLTEPRLLSDPGRIWLVLQLGVPVAGQALTGQALSSQTLAS